MPSDAPRTGLHGLFRVGKALLALHIEVIREVTPRPAALVPFPALRADVMGAIELRGSLIPVMDIALSLGMAPSDGAVILVMRAGGGVIGMFIDEICGVLDLDARALSPLAMPGATAPALVAAGFVHGAHHGALLDPHAIAALPGLAVTTDHPVDRAHHADAGDPVLLFDCDGVPLGLAASAVDATVPVARLLPPAAETPLWIGMLMHAGRRIPVIDTLRLLGLGAIGRAAETASVVVRMEDNRLVALAIAQVCDMRRLRADEIMPLQRFEVGEPGLLRGLYPAERAHLLIDHSALCADPRLRALSLIEEEAAAGVASDGPARRVEPFLIIALGGATCAVPLAQVEEIIPVPAERIDLGATGSSATALVAHRGRGVPLVDLAARLGLATVPCPPRFVVMVEHEGDHMGFLIETLVAVERVPVQRLAGTASQSGATRRVPAATVRLPDGRTCSVVDLAQIIAAERKADPLAA